MAAALYDTGQDHQAPLTSENAHLLTTYAPVLVATIANLVFRSVFFTYLRMLPYFRMADQNNQFTEGVTAKKSVGGCYHPYPSMNTEMIHGLSGRVNCL